jgi:uncharacterized membrane-anchored protein
MALLTSESARLIGRLRKSFGPRNPRSQIIEMQQLLLADIRNPATKPTDRAQCVRAYDVLEERLRILANKPLPGQLRPDLRLEQSKPKRLLPSFRSMEAIELSSEPKAVKESTS